VLKKFLSYLLFFFPSFLNVPIRKLMGQKIGKHTKIKLGTILLAKTVEIGDNSTLGPFSIIKTENIRIGKNSTIKPLSILSTREIIIDDYVHIAPLCIINSEFTQYSKIEIGNHSRLFPFCWLDTGKGIKIGKHVGIGGHTLIFTHGVWSNYMKGGPISYGPVTIEDNVWLPWRIFVLPNVTIGENTIVGANSLINKSHPKNTLIAGNPAKVLRENIIQELSNEEKVNRLFSIIENFKEYVDFKFKIDCSSTDTIFSISKIKIDSVKELKNGDILLINTTDFNTYNHTELINSNISIIDFNSNDSYSTKNKNELFILLISYLRGYGIRLNKL
jgi:acetyltransferase-like isoleucine patch superfamily enzyme